MSEYLDIADADVRQVSSTVIEVDLSPKTNTALLQDHFAGHPIVPGVIQLRWVFGFAKVHLAAHLPENLPAYTIKNLKFSAPMTPHKVYLLRIESSGSRLTFKTSLRSKTATQPVASGVIEFDSC